MERPGADSGLLLRIGGHEIRQAARDGRLRLASILTLILLLAVLGDGILEAGELRQERTEAQEVMREQWLGQGEKNPHSAAHHGIYAFRPASALTFLDPGLNPHVGEAIWLEAHHQNQPVYRPSRGRAALGSFGDLTVSWIVMHLMPALVILLCFEMYARERESGLLAYVLSTGVSAAQLAWGKIVGIMGMILILLAPVAAISVVALGVAESLSWETGMRLVLLLAAYFGFLAVWALISIAVSAVAPSGRAALLALLSLWAIQGFLVPRAAAEISWSWHPIPSAESFQSQIARDMEEGVDGHDPQAERTLQLRDSVLAAHGVESVDELPINFEGVALQAGEEYGNRVFDRRYAELWEQMEAQNRVQLWASLLSPTMAIRALSMGLAGTDWHHTRHFQEEAEDYRRMLVREMNEALIHEFVSQDYGDNLHGADLWDQIPAFHYEPPTLRRVARGQIGAAGFLGAWLVLGLGLTSVLTVRTLGP